MAPGVPTWNLATPYYIVTNGLGFSTKTAYLNLVSYNYMQNQLCQPTNVQLG